VESLGIGLLDTLLKMAPTREEEIKLKEYREDALSKLGPAESFLKAVLTIPFAFKRVEAMLYITNFDSEADYLKTSFKTLEVLKSCRILYSVFFLMELTSNNKK
jgi:hypothetical protein